MNTFLIIGMTGEGKSEFIKRTLRPPKPMFVFDVNNEYKDLSLDMKQTRSRYTGYNDTGGPDYLSEKRFIELSREKRNSNIVFEEATGFFSGATGKELNKLLIEKRHTKNNLFFLFHTINSIPPGILEKANFAVLFKTGDTPQSIPARKSKLKPYAEALQRYPTRKEGQAAPYKPFIIKLI